jgi:hypothetical protein
MDVNEPAPPERANLWTIGLRESLGRVATLAAAALSAPIASVMSADARALPGLRSASGIGDRRSASGLSLCAEVVGSEGKVIIGDIRLGRCPGDADLPGPARVIAWAGVPVRDQDGHVAGVLWVADQKPRNWSASDVAILETLAEVAWSDVTLRAALAQSAGRAALAQTLEESLLPPPLPGIPGLQVAARYAAAGTGAAVLADFCDVFPSALVRTANGHVHEFGRPGTLLGVLARPELHDAQRLLRLGDSLIMFSDGVTEARDGLTRDLYGDERLRHLVAGLGGDLTAAAMADAIRFATMTFSGGRFSDDMVALVMKVPA